MRPPPTPGRPASLPHAPAPPVSLRALARRLGLAPATVSVVLNARPIAATIPAATQARIFAAAEAMGYRPNFTARSLRNGRSYTIGVLAPEVSEGYTALTLSGIEAQLLAAGYFYFVASHHHRPERIAQYAKLLLDRAVEGLIVLDTALPRGGATRNSVPVVAISGHQVLPGVTRIVLDHRRAARLALEHLAGLGHRRIAFIQGQAFSSDTRARWEAIVHAAAAMGLAVDSRRVAQLEGEEPTSEPGYQAARRLLAAGGEFTALFAFNDLSAIGAIRALRETRQVPEEVSVVGFDDVPSAAFQHPPLTTVRQPLRAMGAMAAQLVLERLAARPAAGRRVVTVEPELIVRGTTARAPA